MTKAGTRFEATSIERFQRQNVEPTLNIGVVSTFCARWVRFSEDKKKQKTKQKKKTKKKTKKNVIDNF